MSNLHKAFCVVVMSMSLAACGGGEGGDGGRDVPSVDVVSVDNPSAPETGSDVPTMGGGCGNEYRPCNPVTNAGCMAGQGCYTAGPAMSVCAMAGRGVVGTACMTPDECQEGLGCIGGKCAKWCCMQGDNTPCRTGANGRPGALCNVDVNAGSIFACSYVDNCSVHSQNCPNMGDVCLLAGADGTVQCGRSNGTGMPNMHCMSLNACPRGYACAGPDAANSNCRQFCDPTGMAMGDFVRCPAGFMCGRLNGQPPNIGICIPMM
jgi:hypothetical protein